MKLSAFGEKFAATSGIVALMDDLGVALNENPDAIFMGGGNPARIPAVEERYHQTLQEILDDPELRHNMLGIYQSPQGDLEFRNEIAQYLNSQFDWPLSARNISVCNGSQSAFFLIFNMLAGTMPDGRQHHIHLPLAPEYLGYADSGLSHDFFRATKPRIELLDGHLFKYHIDFERLAVDDSTAALCVSRPTNPTGNVLTDNEIARLDAIAQQHDIPLIIDGAYGLPFPNILFNEATPHWNENTILLLSLSKLGLPGARTGIIVASEEFSRALSNANTISSLACGTLGPAIGKRLLANSALDPLCKEHIQPFYAERAERYVDLFRGLMNPDLPYRVHKPEGAFFLWLWLDQLPISSHELYQRLKERNVLVVPGEPFFVGLDSNWPHASQCLRISYAQDEDSVRRGFEIISAEVERAYTL
ncbi:MAG: valine--pyruvate transaminase [Pseudomonadales bacterium]